MLLSRPIIQPTIVSSAFDPATLALTGWWRASFTASPWTPTASAGSSGANGNLAEATNPPTSGTAQNGFNPAAFDGINQVLTSANNFSTFVTGGAGSIWVLFYATAAAADAGAGLRIGNPGLVFQDTGGTTFGIGYSDAGVTVAYYDGAYEELVIAASLNNYHLAQVKWDSTNLKMRVDSGARSSIAAAAMTLSANPIVVGKNYTTGYQACRVLEVGTINSALSDADEDNIKSYVNSRYGLAL